MKRALLSAVAITLFTSLPQLLAETVMASIAVGDHPIHVAVNYKTNRIYASGTSTNQMWVINGRNNTLMATITLPANPLRPAVNSLTNRIYVPLERGLVAVIDGATNQIVTTIETGGQPIVAAVNLFTNRIYVTNLAGTLFVIDGARNTLIGNIPLGRMTQGVDVNPFTNRIYAINRGDGTLSVVDGESNKVTATVSVTAPSDVDDAGLHAVAVNVATNRIYALWTHANGGTLAIVRGSDNRLIGEAPAGPAPQWLAVNPLTNRIYVSNDRANTVTVLDSKSNTILQAVSVGISPNGVATNPFTGRIYVAVQFEKRVKVIRRP